MASQTFATAINCIDGRVQQPVADWLKQYINVDFVDTITEPGADLVLSGGSTDKIEGIRQKVLLSVKAHQSNTVAVAGHYNCAANPVSDEEHRQHIEQATNAVRAWGLPLRVIGLWVDHTWQVNVVGDTFSDQTV